MPLSPTRVLPLTNNGIAQAPGLSLAILRIGSVPLPLLRECPRAVLRIGGVPLSLPLSSLSLHPFAILRIGCVPLALSSGLLRAILGVGSVPLAIPLFNPLATPLAILRIGSVPLPLLRECPRVSAARAVPRVRVSFGDANVAVLAGAGARVGHFVVPLDGGSVAIASTEASARGSVSASPLMIIRSPSARLACRRGRRCAWRSAVARAGVLTLWIAASIASREAAHRGADSRWLPAVGGMAVLAVDLGQDHHCCPSPLSSRLASSRASSANRLLCARFPARRV